MSGKKQPRSFNAADFEKILGEVRKDLDALQLNETIFSGIAEQITRFPHLFRNFPAIFGAFNAAMRTDLIIRLGRIYDPEKNGYGSCTLSRCLNIPKENPHFFTEAAIAARLSEAYRRANPDYLQWHRPNVPQIEADLARIDTSRQRLIRLRNKFYAHKDVDTALSGQYTDFLSSHEEVRDLIQLAFEIWNRISITWCAASLSERIHGVAEEPGEFVRNLRFGMKTRSWIERFDLERIKARQRRRMQKRTEG